MSKVTDQPSGVVPGSMDISTDTSVDPVHPMSAADALASRRWAGLRARKASERMLRSQRSADADSGSGQPKH
jgi:hypothetical protein